MKDQNLFWSHWKLVIKLIKRDHFWQITDFVFYNNLRLRHDSEFPKFWPRAIEHALIFDMSRKVFS